MTPEDLAEYLERTNPELLTDWTRARDLTRYGVTAVNALAGLELLVLCGIAEGGRDEYGARVFRRRTDPPNPATP